MTLLGSNRSVSSLSLGCSCICSGFFLSIWRGHKLVSLTRYSTYLIHQTELVDGSKREAMPEVLQCWTSISWRLLGPLHACNCGWQTTLVINPIRWVITPNKWLANPTKLTPTMVKTPTKPCHSVGTHEIQVVRPCSDPLWAATSWSLGSCIELD